jgi:hypothetical protein
MEIPVLACSQLTTDCECWLMTDALGLAQSGLLICCWPLPALLFLVLGPYFFLGGASWLAHFGRSVMSQKYLICSLYSDVFMILLQEFGSYRMTFSWKT